MLQIWAAQKACWGGPVLHRVTASFSFSCSTRTWTRTRVSFKGQQTKQGSDPQHKGKSIGKFGTKTRRRYPWLRQPEAGVQQVTQQQIQYNSWNWLCVYNLSFIPLLFPLSNPVRLTGGAGVYPAVTTHHLWLFFLFFFWSALLFQLEVWVTPKFAVSPCRSGATQRFLLSLQVWWFQAETVKIEAKWLTPPPENKLTHLWKCQKFPKAWDFLAPYFWPAVTTARLSESNFSSCNSALQTILPFSTVPLLIEELTFSRASC